MLRQRRDVVTWGEHIHCARLRVHSTNRGRLGGKGTRPDVWQVGCDGPVELTVEDWVLAEEVGLVRLVNCVHAEPSGWDGE